MKVMTGAYIGTGAALNVDSVGFMPGFVQLFNKTGLVIAAWTQEMGDGAAHKVINHDTAQNVFVTANGITPRPTGFQVGTDADLNTVGETVYWVAHETARSK